MATWSDQQAELLARDGYVILPGVFTHDEIHAAMENWERICATDAARPNLLTNDAGIFGARHILTFWPTSVSLGLDRRLTDIMHVVLGDGAGLVRGLFFDKPPGGSWTLPIHRDRTIAVQESDVESVAGFSKPTRKAGVNHVEAPDWLLARMLTARIHLDPMTEDNGPLKVVPGSHLGDDTRPAVTLECSAGDVLLMRPLILHASGHSQPSVTQHRRIVHLEYASDRALPDPIRWFEFHPIK